MEGLSLDYFGKDEELIRGLRWNWKTFRSTEDYPVSENLLDWVVGQEQALKECYLCLDRVNLTVPVRDLGPVRALRFHYFAARVLTRRV